MVTRFIPFDKTGNYRIYAKNKRGEFYAKDEKGDEISNMHAYARLFEGGQYYPKTKDGKEEYSTFLFSIQKYAKDKEGNQTYAKTKDGFDYCALLTNTPEEIVYYAKLSNRQERYPRRADREIGSTGSYTRSESREEFYPKIYYD